MNSAPIRHEGSRIVRPEFMGSEPRTSQDVIDEAIEEAGRRADVYAARFRVLALGLTTIAAMALRLSGLVTLGPIAPFWIGSYLAFSVGALWYVGRRQRRGPAFAAVTHALDIAFIGAYGPIIMTAVPEHLSHEDAVRFIIYVTPMGMLSAMAVAAQRGSRTISTYLAIAAMVVALLVLIRYDGFRPAQAYVALSILLTGLSGHAVASRGRRVLGNLERMKMLRAFVPEEVQERVITDPNAAFAVGGEVHTLTMLVCDLRGFTAMAERLPPDEVVEQVNAFHAAMLEVTRVHEGKLDKFLGDGALVVFGLDRESGRTSGRRDHGAHAAVSCARAMLRALSDLNEERSARHLEPLEMGIGIHTGRVVAGNIGVPEVRLEWTVIGDAVNTAARIQGACREVGAAALVSADTVALLPDKTGLREVPPLQLKGKASKVPVFALGGQS